MKDINHTISNKDIGFEYDDLTKDNDFVILKLGSPLILNQDVKPACLPASKSYLGIDVTEDKCFTSGWGNLEYGKKQLCVGNPHKSFLTYLLSH